MIDYNEIAEKHAEEWQTIYDLFDGASTPEQVNLVMDISRSLLRYHYLEWSVYENEPLND